MSNINKIKVSGTTYNIQDENACKVVELTQAQYDELPTTAKTSNSLFVITDATAGDLSNYYTKTEADDAITAATSTKQDTLVSGTNIKTINNKSILGEGNITIEGGGGGITVDQSLDSGSTNAVANSAITNAINDRQLKREYVGTDKVFASEDTRVINGKRVYIIHPVFRCYSNNDTNTELVLNNKDLGLYFPIINGKNIFSTDINDVNFLTDVLEPSAITTSVSSESTDAQVPSAKAVNDKLGGLSIVKLTQSEYDSLSTKDNSTLYLIVN